MAPAGPLVFAGKSVAASVIKEIVTRAFNYLGGYFNAESMEEMKNKLERGMPKIQAVLDFVNPEHIREQSSALDAWLWQLRDAVEEAEDAIDELEYYDLEEKAEDRKVSDWGSSFAKMKHKVVRSVKHVRILDKTVTKITHRGTLKKLMKAMESLDKAATGVASFLNLMDHLKETTSSSQQNNDRETGSTLSAATFVGREKEKGQIIGWLTKTSVESAEIVTSTNCVPIISVVGHGGMGKTALAQSICEEDGVTKYFKVIWVTVSTSFDALSVTSKILECATGEKPSATHLEPLQQDLKDKLKSINFFLILDDVWEDKKMDEWEKLFAPLRKVNNGSKILLTTRMRSVADMAASVMGVERDQCLILEGLEQEENIKLFNHHVFSGLNRQDYVYLKLIGEQIVMKLGGCPLVTKVVSGHLQGNITLEYWSSFLHEELEHFKGTEEDIMKVLKLSYYHLPTELQICFRYCCLFPQNYNFDKRKLVLMWIGSGLISHVTSGSQTFEDTGEQILSWLTRKSFFDLKFRVYYGALKEEYYVMHDLIHDLARNVSFGECARITDPARFEDERDTVRHLCVACIHSFSVREVKKISHFKNLRTITIDSYHEVDKDIVCALETIVQGSKSLRLFHSRLANTFHFAGNFGNLKHLRYIHLRQISPEGMRGVVKLYHLMLLHCHIGVQRETKQVRYLGNLDSLRYVSYGVDGLGEFPISRLTSLQVLNNYCVPGSTCNKIGAIRNLRGLRMLELKGLENVENHEEATSAKLNEKQYLSWLSLEWSVSSGAQNRENDLVLDHLEPHASIRELTISGYKGLRLPFWIESLSVKNLVSLKLIRCINWEQLPFLGELLLLKHLRLDKLPKLQEIGRSSYMSSNSSMEFLLPPNLVTLIVIQCQKLRELPILPPSLVSLHIQDAGLTKLPMIGTLLSESIETKPSQLLRISVNHCPCLTSLEGSLLEQFLCMRALSLLRIRGCCNLVSGSIPFEEMTKLKELDISSYPKSRRLKDAGDELLLPSSLTKLTMGQCGDLELALPMSLKRLCNLRWLELSYCLRLVSLPSADVFACLKSLECMTIGGCKNLSSLGGLGSLPSLEHLHIIECGKLTEARSHLTPDASGGEEEHLVQIHSLQIDLPSLLLVEPLKSLCHTQVLLIRDGSEMESLPERWLLQNRSSLRSLQIDEATSLESLPLSMRDLSSLEVLSLSDAKQIRSLPDLPSSLQNLYVSGCNPELENRSREYGSPEWNKITHMHRVRIGDSYFIMGEVCSEETFDRLRYSDHNTLTSWVDQQKDDKIVESLLPWWKKRCCLKNAS